MKPSLSSVTHLIINTLRFTQSPALHHDVITIVSSYLVVLAKACPLLQTLELNGEVGPAGFAAFGSSCPNITRLVATSFSLPFNNLLTVFPSLVHVEVNFHCDMHASAAGYCSNAARALSHSTKLETMVLPYFDIKHASSWTLLPASLKTLKIGVCEAAPPPGTTLTALKVLSFGSKSDLPSMRTSPPCLVSILHAMPQLQLLDCCAVTLCDANDLASLFAINNICLNRIGTPPHITLEPAPTGSLHEGSNVQKFLAPSPVLPALTGLTIMDCLGGSEGTKQLIRVFPNLISLELSDPTGILEATAGLLVKLTLLQTLTVSLSASLTGEGVLALMRLPSLKNLHLVNCKQEVVASARLSAAREGLLVKVQ